MYAYNESKSGRKYIFFLIIVVAIAILNSSISLASDSPEIQISDTNYSYSISTADERIKVTEFKELYTSIISDEKFTSSTIVLNGTSTTMIELPSDSSAVILPDKRIIVKYSDEKSSILQDGSNIIYYNDDPVIDIPDQSAVFKVSKIIVLPIENFTLTASFDQSIYSLDYYKLKIVINELNNPNLSDNIVSYSIDWGDGSIEDYDVDTMTASHTYKKSGIYNLAFNITDDFGLKHTIKQSYEVDYEGHLMHTYFWVKENKEPVAVTTSTSFSILALGLIALTETGKYKFLALLPLLIPMYTRIQKEDVLDQFVRGQIFGYIKTNPGVHYNEIRRGIGIKNGTLSYHLSVLEKTELVKSRREGLRYRAFYPTGMRFPDHERFRLTELQINILDIIKNNNGVNQKEIATQIGKKPQTINYNIRILEQAGLIEVRRIGRKTGCYLVEDEDFSKNIAH